MTGQYQQNSINIPSVTARRVAADATLSTQDSMVVVNSVAATVTLTLPNSATEPGKWYDIVAVTGSTFPVRIAATAPDTLNGVAGGIVLLENALAGARVRAGFPGVANSGWWITANTPGTDTVQLATIAVATAVSAWVGTRMALVTNVPAIAITLPAVTNVPIGSVLKLSKTAGAGAATLTPFAGDTINGLAVFALALNKGVTLTSFGTGQTVWHLSDAV